MISRRRPTQSRRVLNFDRLDVGATYYEMALLISHGQDGHLFLLQSSFCFPFHGFTWPGSHAPMRARAKTEVDPAIPLTPLQKTFHDRSSLCRSA
jgi:hypothetical protein